MIDREQFLARRKSGIGGSDISAIAGLNPWRSPLDIYYDKLNIELGADGHDTPEPMGRTAALYWGSVHEAEIGKAYTAVTGRRIMRHNAQIVHCEVPYFIGDVDFLAYGEDGKRPFHSKRGITTDKGVECKTARYATDEWGECGTDQIPIPYLFQVQWYMGLVPCLKSFDLPVLFGGSEFAIYTVWRDEAVIARLQEIGAYFWTENVLKQIPPPPRSYEEVKRVFPAMTGKRMLASVELERQTRKLAKASSLRIKLETIEAGLKDKISVAMQDSELLVLPDETILATFKNEKKGRVLRLKKIKSEGR